MKSDKEEAHDHGHHTCAGAAGASKKNQDLYALVGSPIDFTFELHDVKPIGAFEQKVWEMSPRERYEAIPALKERGNACFRRKEYEEACASYFKAMSHVEILLAASESSEIPGVGVEEVCNDFLLARKVQDPLDVFFSH